MSRITLVACLTILFLLPLDEGVVLAGESGPGSGPAARAYLPAAAAMGEGWTAWPLDSIAVPAAPFREGAAAAYGGPGGARVVVAALLATDGRVAVRQSWEEAIGLYEGHRRRLEYDGEREDRLTAAAPPPGCVEAKRVEGADDDFGFAAGIVLCAVDPDLILLVVASGDVLGLEGAAAADAVVALALGAGAETGTDSASPVAARWERG